MIIFGAPNHVAPFFSFFFIDFSSIRAHKVSDCDCCIHILIEKFAYVSVYYDLDPRSKNPVGENIISAPKIPNNCGAI